MAKEKVEIKTPFKQMMDWLFSQYDFKRDLLKNAVHFKPTGDKEFKELTDDDINTISITMELKGLKKFAEKDICRAIYSSFNPGNYDPLKTYFNRISKKNPKGAIDKLAATIKTTNTELWNKYLKKWLVACVANYMEIKGCQNHTCLVLTGGQGKGKTTWLNGICPPELNPAYIYTGRLDLSKQSDTNFKLADYWFINIEEQMKNLNRQDANAVKALITLSDIKGRKPYGRIEVSARRLANFMGSTNDDDFITDETGSRRFLPFKVTDINLPGFKKIDIDEVWSEAFRLYESGFVYWITQDDQIELEANNKEYINHTQEHEYVNIYCSVPKDETDATHVVPASVLRDFIQFETTNKNLRDRNIGVALSQIGFKQVTHRFHWITYPMKAWLIKLNEPTGNASLNKYSIDPSNQPTNETKANTTKPNQNTPPKLDFKDQKDKK